MTRSPVGLILDTQLLSRESSGFGFQALEFKVWFKVWSNLFEFRELHPKKAELTRSSQSDLATRWALGVSH